MRSADKNRRFRENEARPLGPCQIQPMAPLPILDLDDPEIGVEINFARQPLFDIGRIDPFVLMGARPQALDAALGKLRLRRRREERGASVKPVEFDEYGARFRRAAPPQCRDRAFDRASPDIGRDPDVGAKPHAVSAPPRSPRR